MFTYDKRTEVTRKRMLGDRQNIYPNKFYKSADGDFYFYINRKGQYHIIKPILIRYYGQIHHYEIKNYLLTEDNFLKVHGYYGCYKTEEEVIKAIEGNLVS